MDEVNKKRRITVIKNPYPGKFIVFEGLDGSGQSTQAEKLYKFFRQTGRLVILTKEPTENSQAGRKIRKVLRKEIKVESDELQKLFAQDRKKHLKTLIKPALKEGKYVISDRYFLSTYAFGGIDLDIEWLINLNNDFILPDITFFLDVSPEICLKRIGRRGKRFEFFEKREKLTRIRKNYLSLAARFKGIHLINGELLKIRVFDQIIKVLATKDL